MSENYVDIVFEGGDGPEGPRFVEVEDSTGASVKFGSWIKRADGYWVLRIPREAAVQEVAPSKTDEQRHPMNKGESNVTAFPGAEYTPYNLVSRVLDKVKELGPAVRHAVLYLSVDVGAEGTAILPFCTNVGFAEMSMISTTSQVMAGRVLQGSTRTSPPPDEPANA